MVTGVVMIAGLCVFEIILAKIALGSAKIEEFNFCDFYEIREEINKQSRITKRA